MEGEPPKSATEVVSDVLHKNTKTCHFLQKVGINIVPQRRRGLSTVEAELEVDRSKNAALEAKINDLSTHVQLSQSKQAELEAKLDLLLSKTTKQLKMVWHLLGANFEGAKLCSAALALFFTDILDSLVALMFRNVSDILVYEEI
jgi:uncharacterized protein YigA (DUF484 family)